MRQQIALLTKKFSCVPNLKKRSLGALMSTEAALPYFLSIDCGVVKYAAIIP